jgi:hypothetical protein
MSNNGFWSFLTKTWKPELLKANPATQQPLFVSKILYQYCTNLPQRNATQRNATQRNATQRNATVNVQPLVVT